MKKFILLILLSTASIASGQDHTSASGVEARKNHDVLSPLIAEKYEYHDVCGCCEKDIQCDMMDKAITWNDGNGYDSITKWKVKWDYGHTRNAGYCYADSFRVTLDIVIQLPRWVCNGQPPRALTEKWDTYIKNLTAHENAHKDLALQAAQKLTHAVAEMPPARTCGELDRAIQAFCRERMEKLDDEQREYDEATGHGFSGKPQFP